MSFGETVKNLRLAQKKTLRQFCQEEGFDPSNWSKIERGVNPPPKGEGTLHRWATALGLKEGTDLWKDFFCEAEISRGNIPRDVMNDTQLLEKLPAFFRTVRGEDPGAGEMGNLICKVREAHAPEYGSPGERNTDEHLIQTTKIALFKGKKIRKIVFLNEWWFSVVDVVEALTDSVNARDYWYKMKIRVQGEEGAELSTFCRQLKLTAPDGKARETDCSNTEGIFRIIQSIPSPKAEPFKRWLARVGYERVKEIEDPELGMKRTRMLYKAKGYPEEWIEKRMRGIAIRQELTDEWQNRGAEHQKDYEILTAEISKATFGVTPSQDKKIKGLKRQNLRDHMDDFELIFSMLGERSTAEITRTEDSRGVPKLKQDAKAGGDIAGGARRQLEKRLRRSIVTRANFLPAKRKK